MKDKMPGRRILLVEDDWELGEGMVSYFLGPFS